MCHDKNWSYWELLAQSYRIASKYENEKCKNASDIFINWSNFNTRYLDEYQDRGIYEDGSLLTTDLNRIVRE